MDMNSWGEFVISELHKSITILTFFLMLYSAKSEARDEKK